MAVSVVTFLESHDLFSIVHPSRHAVLLSIQTVPWPSVSPDTPSQRSRLVFSNIVVFVGMTKAHQMTQLMHVGREDTTEATLKPGCALSGVRKG
jgi:hypothetical protein